MSHDEFERRNGLFQSRRLQTTLVIAACALLAPFGMPLALAQSGDSGDAAEDTPPPPPCSAPEAGQFDFWVGEWDLTWEGGAGTNTITKEMNGCVIRENFVDPEKPYHGLSVSVWNPNRGIWQQTWVDDQGSYLDFEGGIDGDKMVLARQFTGPKGKTVHQRMTFYNIAENSLDWDWEVSQDEGETWKLAWRIHYERTEGSRAQN